MPYNYFINHWHKGSTADWPTTGILPLIFDALDPEKQTKQKKIWTYFKSLQKDNTGVNPLKDNGRLFNSPTDKANILNRQYMSVFTQETSGDIPTTSGTPFPDMDNIRIQEQGIEKPLKNLNPKKATGPDNIPARILKDFAAPMFLSYPLSSTEHWKRGKCQMTGAKLMLQQSTRRAPDKTLQTIAPCHLRASAVRYWRTSL